MDLWIIQYRWMDRNNQWSGWEAIYETTFTDRDIRYVDDSHMTPRPLIDVVERAGRLAAFQSRDDMQFRILGIVDHEVIPVELFA